MSGFIERMSRDLVLSSNDILTIAKTAHHRYKVFQIPKKKANEYRTIAQPAPEVKLLQNWVVQNILKEYSIHPAATAYVIGKNIRLNAEQHIQNPFLLKMDFADFFPSIVPADLNKHLTRYPKLNFAVEEMKLLQRILFWKKKGEDMRLSIGAPSSPYLSNVLMFDFDLLVNDECKFQDIVYTRYADDLVFSAKSMEKLQEVYKFVCSVLTNLHYPKLKINTDKTIFLSKKGNRTVTGIVLTNDNKVSLGRHRKRLISSQIHHFQNQRLSKEEAFKLKGMLCFVKDVEPTFLDSMRKKYGDSVIKNIFQL